MSTSVIAGIAWLASQLSQPWVALAGASVVVDRRAHDRRPRVDAIRFHRLVRDAVVADLRVRERDQLAGVARVGHRLLVAGHRGREHDLPDRVTLRSAREPVEAGPVLEQHVGGGAGHEIAGACARIRSQNATVPAASVSRTLPWSIRPWKQQFSERLK